MKKVSNKKYFCDMSPKDALYLFCRENNLKLPIFKKIKNEGAYFVSEVQLEDFNITARSLESRQNADHRAAAEALRYIQHYQGSATPWPSTIHNICQVFDSVDLNIDESELVCFCISGYPYPWFGIPNEENLISKICQVIENNNPVEISEYIQMLAFQLQFTLEYNIIKRTVNNKRYYCCFLSISKSSNMTLCSIGKEETLGLAKQQAEIEALKIIEIICGSAPVSSTD